MEYCCGSDLKDLSPGADMVPGCDDCRSRGRIRDVVPGAADGDVGGGAPRPTAEMSVAELQELVLQNTNRIRELTEEVLRLRGGTPHAAPGSGSAVVVSSPTAPGRSKSGCVGELSGGVGWKLESEASFEKAQHFIEKRDRRAQRRSALFSGTALVLLGMPFGPVGMVAGGILGAISGGTVGFCIDRHRRHRQLFDSEATKCRLESLIRWALARADDPAAVRANLSFVILEFKPVADIADGSPSAQQLLRLLNRWLRKKTVTRALFAMMDDFLLQWRVRTPGDIISVLHVFQTVDAVYRYSPRSLGDCEKVLLCRIERLLHHESVALALAQAEATKEPSETEGRVIDSILMMDDQGRSQAIDDADRDCPSLAGGCDSIAKVPSTVSSAEVGAETAPGAPMSCDEEDKSESVHSSLSPAGATAFFKSWGDYMEFDLAIKHKIPIARCEFDFLLQKEAEGENGWDLCIDRKEIKVCRQMAGTGTVFIRAWARVPGVDILAAFHLFYDTSLRLKWDTVFSEMKLAPERIQGSDVLYSSLRVPFITPRDFLQYRRVTVLEDGTILIVLRSAEHEDFPERKGVIRAESFISGYVLRQSHDEEGKPVMDLFLMACSDVKGLMPKWIVNTVAPKKPAEWVDALTTFAHNYQQANPGYREELLGILDEFRTCSSADTDNAERRA